MTSWRNLIGLVASNVEETFDDLKYGLGRRLGGDDPIKIVSYRGYGTRTKLYVKGRVLEDQGLTPPEDSDSVWENLLNMYRRFATDEIPGARVRLRLGEAELEVTANEEGFFEAWLEPAEPLPADLLWAKVEVELLSPQRQGHGPVRTAAEVLVPPASARFGVISDIDDTVVRTNNTSLLLMARTVFLGNARTRLPFEGVAAFYRALLAGAAGQAGNPLFYVSSSPWNLYDLLVDFFQVQDIPAGPIFLRDWGVSQQELLPLGHRSHKLAAIRQIMELYDPLPFILLGDSSQQDPEIYHELVNLYPHRILAIFIRNVNREPERLEAIEALAREVIAAGSTLILADNTLPLAEYAAEQGWISPATLPHIQAEKEIDAGPPGPVEALLADEAGQEPGPTVTIEAGTPAAADAVETALQAGDGEEPPTVVVEGEGRK